LYVYFQIICFVIINLVFNHFFEKHLRFILLHQPFYLFIF